MHCEVVEIRCPIRRITKQNNYYVIYLNIQTINLKDMKVKTSRIRKLHPIAATDNHLLPTESGLKEAKDLKVGDVMLLSLNLICK